MVEGLGHCQYSGSSLIAIGRGVVIIVAVVLMVVVVVADMEVKVEEAGAELPVPMPVASRVQAETADHDDAGQSESRVRQAGTADHGSAKALHQVSGLDSTRPPPPGWLRGGGPG